MSTEAPAITHLDEPTWQLEQARHRARVEPWVSGRLARKSRGQRHAIEDFLFDYYPYTPGKLVTWHPGYGIELGGQEAEAYLKLAGYRSTGDGATADLAWLEPRRARLDVAISILDGAASRPPMTGCFGMHEWAMTYGLTQEELRHAYLPLRVTPGEVTATVDAIGLRCTHMDAFRFFTPDALPLNELQPTRETQPALEQPGCLHASMDVYKYAFWFSPLVPSDLIMDCFENAVSAREIDMRASPYDMDPFGLEAIRVETPEGRREYAAAQVRLMGSTAPLRERLLARLTVLRSALANSPVSAPGP